MSVFSWLRTKAECEISKEMEALEVQAYSAFSGHDKAVKELHKRLDKDEKPNGEHKDPKDGERT